MSWGQSPLFVIKPSGRSRVCHWCDFSPEGGGRGWGQYLGGCDFGLVDSLHRRLDSRTFVLNEVSLIQPFL